MSYRLTVWRSKGGMEAWCFSTAVDQMLATNAEDGSQNGVVVQNALSVLVDGRAIDTLPLWIWSDWQVGPELEFLQRRTRNSRALSHRL